MTTVNKCVLSIVTKNPKYRPLSGIAGGCYSTMLGLVMTTGIILVLCQEKVQVKCAQFPRSCRPGQPARAATDSAIVVRYSASY